MTRSTMTAVAILMLACGPAAAQAVRAPTVAPNLSVAAASGVDIALLRQEIQKLEAAHNTTRTELAQTRLQLTAAQSQLATTQNRLGVLAQAVRNFGVCQNAGGANGAAGMMTGGAVPVTCASFLAALPAQ